MYEGVEEMKNDGKRREGGSSSHEMGTPLRCGTDAEVVPEA
jgi:hypothetical protein